MRIATIIESRISQGGGFNQSINAVLRLKEICGGRHELLAFTSVPEDLSYLDSLGIQASVFQIRGFERLARPFPGSRAFEKLQELTGIGGSFEKSLLKLGVDLAYFVGHSVTPLYLRRIGYISTVWDVCHLDQPEFHEAASRREFFEREFAFSSTLSRAAAVVCATELLGGKLSRHYGVDTGRLIAVPFSPSPFLTHGNSTDSAEVLRKYGLHAGYYFYPAQFWPHKNHIRILQALKALRAQGIERRAVFSGKDHGNLPYLRAEAVRLGVQDLISVIGFVPPEDMRGLYESCLAVVMPTYFGPTNIPPLEAWSLGKPLVYSSHLREQAGEAAILVDPDSSESMVAALLKLEQVTVREELIAKGFKRLRSIELERLAGEKALRDCIESFSKKLECWRRASAES